MDPISGSKCADCPHRRFLPVTDQVIRLRNGGCGDVRGHAFQDRFVNELAKFG